MRLAYVGSTCASPCLFWGVMVGTNMLVHQIMSNLLQAGKSVGIAH